MSLRTKFFAMTYDRQIAGAEKAGLRAFRERLYSANPPAACQNCGLAWSL